MENLLVKNVLIFIILIIVGALFSLLALRLILFIINKGASIGDSLKSTSISILSSVSIVSLGLIFSKLYDPLIEITRILSDGENYFIESLKYISLFLGLSFISWFLIIGSSVSLFGLMTKGVNEIEEIKNDNWKLALLLSALILMLTIMASGPILGSLEALIPYPDMPNIV